MDSSPTCMQFTVGSLDGTSSALSIAAQQASVSSDRVAREQRPMAGSVCEERKKLLVEKHVNYIKNLDKVTQFHARMCRLRNYPWGPSLFLDFDVNLETPFCSVYAAIQNKKIMERSKTACMRFLLQPDSCMALLFPYISCT